MPESFRLAVTVRVGEKYKLKIRRLRSKARVHSRLFRKSFSFDGNQRCSRRPRCSIHSRQILTEARAGNHAITRCQRAFPEWSASRSFPGRNRTQINGYLDRAVFHLFLHVHDRCSALDELRAKRVAQIVNANLPNASSPQVASSLQLFREVLHHCQRS